MTFKILALCGGGMRGLLSTRILERLYRLDHDLLSRADVLAGTSTGCDIISYHLSGKTAPDIYRVYRDEAWMFFLDGNTTDPGLPAYSVDALYNAQLKLWKDRPDVRLCDFEQRLVMTTFDIVDWRPVVANSFIDSDTRFTKLVDAVVSSSAMPGMFGAWKGKIDGAFVSHDPSIPAMSAALGNIPSAVRPKFEDISIICIGTGLMKNWVRLDAQNWGVAQMAYCQDIPMNTAGKGDMNVYPLFINGGMSITGNAALNGTSTNMTQTMVGQMLGDRYAYLDAWFDQFIPENTTDQKTLDYMVERADAVDLGPVLDVIGKYWG